MADELQSLLDRIQHEGLDKAKLEADRIVAEARKKADAMVNEAHGTADALRKKAEADAEAFAARARKTVQQAGRDVILWIGEAVGKLLTDVLRAETGKLMSDDFLKQLLSAAVESYCRGPAGGVAIEVLVPPAQEKGLAEFVRQKLAAKCVAGIEIHGDRDVVGGFRIRMADGRVQHDFTSEAIAATLGRMLRPPLTTLVQNALKT